MNCKNTLLFLGQCIKGDLIKLALIGDFDVIIHGCNCLCTMGAGIAKAIKSEFPEAYKADRATEKGDKSKLGTYTSATVERGGHKITIVNAYTQYNYRGRGRKADYDAMKSVFQAIKRDFAGQQIGYPLIGAGLAGGEWEVISEIIDEALKGEDHTLVEFDPNA
ncbi:MAG: macro domain-containing protein [Chloroflexota bacterium]